MLNEVVRGGVQVEKDDLELGKSEALGGADHSALDAEGYLGSSLEGIQFTVVNASEHGVMVEDTYRPKGTVVAVIETAWNPEKGGLHRPDRIRHAALRNLFDSRDGHQRQLSAH